MDCCTASAPPRWRWRSDGWRAWCSGAISSVGVIVREGGPLIRQTALRREGVEPVLAEHVRGEGERAEQIAEYGLAHVEPAGERAEGRHHDALTVGRKASAAHRAAAMRDPRGGMQMAADFARRAVRQMPEQQTADLQFRFERSADALARLGVV